MIIFKLFGNIENSFLAPSDTIKKSRKAEIPVEQLHSFRLCMIQVFGKGEWHNQICLRNQSAVAVLQTNVSEKNHMRFEIKHDWEWWGRCGFSRITDDRLDEDVIEKKSVLPCSITSYCLLWTVMGGCHACILGYSLRSWGSSLTVAEAVGTDEFTVGTNEFSRMRRGFRENTWGVTVSSSFLELPAALGQLLMESSSL